MKLLTLDRGGEFRPAVLVGTDALDLAAAGLPATMRTLLAGGAEMLARIADLVRQAAAPDVAEALRAAGTLASLESLTLGPVVPDPRIVLAGSMNSWGHQREMKGVTPDHPCGFHKVASALSASGAAIPLPPEHGEMVDWEGEFCVVIGTRCHRVAEADAMDHVAGYTLLNDVSAREYAFEFIRSGGDDPVKAAQAWERNVLGKNYPGFAPIGPVIVTRDEMPSPLAYHLETLVNGEIMQSSTQDDLIFGPARMISYFSQFLTFEPGDIISMGSPPGVGMARRPPQFLRPGDVVEVRAAPIGTLRNPVVASA